MEIGELTAAEQRLWRAFPRREQVDLSDAGDREVRASVIQALLLGAQAAEPGHLAAVVLVGAHVTGVLDLSYAEVVHPVRMARCRFDNAVELVGARLRELSLSGSQLPGLRASKMAVAGALEMSHVRFTGRVSLAGARIEGALLLNAASVEATDGVAVNAARLVVGQDLCAQRGFRSTGELVLNDAVVNGSLLLDGATISSPSGLALTAHGLAVRSVANCCDGFTATGKVSFTGAKVGSRLCFADARLSNPDGTALSCRHVQTNQLVLTTAAPVRGAFDLRYARVGLLRDDPAVWPAVILLQGLTVDTVEGRATLRQRLEWLRRDPDGYLPQPYEQLAALYRRHGQEDQARTVLLAGQRHRRHSQPLPVRAWGYVQDVVLGFGYRPARAAAWFAALMAAGALYFTDNPPAPVSGAPSFVPLLYSLDLLLPVIDLGQESGFQARGAGAWIAAGLILAGWVLATTIAVAAARLLRRP
ncbi:MAG TPA: hypothetical protein VFM55_21255 [Micromonosporaceae bacterium]|nr:hypothetical protein [Micromonosporaceae bacterium]